MSTTPPPPAPRNVEGNAEMVTVVDLLPWTEYEFRVIATNALGAGEPSEPSSLTTTLEAGMCLDRISAYLLKVFVFFFFLCTACSIIGERSKKILN